MLGALGFGAVAAAASRVEAQRARTLTACTPDAFAVCAEVRLTAGPSVFELALRTVGATGAPALPVTFYNVVFGTGAAPAATGVTTAVTPFGEGGAVVGDPTAWEVFDTGDALFVSALTNRGVGGCVAGPDVGGFGQAVTTCGVGQFAVFRFIPTAVFDPDRFELLNLEAVGLRVDLPAATCGGAGAACVITADTRLPTSVPEPQPGALVPAGVGVIVAIRRYWTRHRRPVV